MRECCLTQLSGEADQIRVARFFCCGHPEHGNILRACRLSPATLCPEISEQHRQRRYPAPLTCCAPNCRFSGPAILDPARSIVGCGSTCSAQRHSRMNWPRWSFAAGLSRIAVHGCPCDCYDFAYPMIKIDASLATHKPSAQGRGGMSWALPRKAEQAVRLAQ